MAHTYRTEREIAAPAALVWEILEDLDRYPEWNPFTPRVETSFEIGAPITLHVSFDGRRPFAQVERLRQWQPGEALRWDMRIGPQWLFRAERSQRVERLGAARCRYVTTDAFAGVLSPVVELFYGGRVQRGFEAMALALEQRALARVVE